MAVLVDKLYDSVLGNTNNCDEVIIISGYVTPDIIKEIADSGKKVTFYYGMYRMDGITTRTLAKMKELNEKYDNLEIYFVNDYHVHTKCYIYYKDGSVQNVLVGSANCSRNGLLSEHNSEMLVELNEQELKNDLYLKRLSCYAEEVAKASVICDDPAILPTQKNSIKRQKKEKNRVPDTGNPFVAHMPLYTYEKGKKVVQKAHGLNWGLQSGNSKKGTGYAEANIPIYAEHIDNHPIMFPFFPEMRQTTTGKSTRRYDSITVLWDDGTVMEMVFGGNGVERPTKGKRKAGEPYHAYPKQMTSGKEGDGGGALLGEYLRKRMNVPPRKRITMSDLKKYKRDYIELTYISPGYYEADFSGTPLE